MASTVISVSIRHILPTAMEGKKAVSADFSYDFAHHTILSTDCKVTVLQHLTRIKASFSNRLNAGKSNQTLHEI